MKANKALKRLAKIEALLSDVAERYSASAPHVRDVLQDAKAAVARAKEALRLQAFSGRPKKSAAIKKAAKKAAAKKAAPTQKKAPIKKEAVKVPTAKTVKKSAPIRKEAKQTARVPVHVATETAAHQPMPAELTPSVPRSSEVFSNTRFHLTAAAPLLRKKR